MLFRSSAAQKLVRREKAVRHSYEVLTSRQLQILRMVAIGLHNKDIGKKLFISEGTVEVHLHNIYQRLDVKSRLELALYARDKELV